MNASRPIPAFWTDIRLLVFAAMAIFLYTIGIGILNGADLVDFDQRRVLGHVHGGTLGWLTLSVFAASLWLFGGERTVSRRERRLVRSMVAAAIGGFAGYITAFSLTYGGWRPALGVVAVLVIAAFFAWVAWRATRIELSVPHWGFLAAMATSITGGVIGVLLGLEIATGRNYAPDGAIHAHPGTMVIGFLTPIALGMSEWAFFFPNPPRATRSGIIQMSFLFGGGLILSTAFLLEFEAILPLVILLQLVAVAIFFKRMSGPLRQVMWRAATPGRYAALAPFYVVFVLGLAFYFAGRYEGDFDLVPLHQGLALDHAQFIGSVTNGVFAMLLAATDAGGRARRLDQLVFVLVNVGLAGFALGLLFDVTVMKRIFAPTMGFGLLLGLGVFAWRLAPGDSTIGHAAPSQEGAPLST